MKGSKDRKSSRARQAHSVWYHDELTTLHFDMSDVFNPMVDGYKA